MAQARRWWVGGLRFEQADAEELAVVVDALDSPAFANSDRASATFYSSYAIPRTPAPLPTVSDERLPSTRIPTDIYPGLDNRRKEVARPVANR